MRYRLAWLLLAAVVLFSPVSQAELEESALAELVSPPLSLGARDSVLPAWTVVDAGGALAGYVFESRELSPIPGFSGTPVNLLVLIDLGGQFLDVRLLEHNEPVFVSGLGERPLHDFVAQYPGKSLGNNIKVDDSHANRGQTGSANVYVDGVAKATASVRIVNESILASALQVARSKLKGVAPRPAATPKLDLFEEHDWASLVEQGLIKHRRVLNRDVEALFAGSNLEGRDDIALEAPN